MRGNVGASARRSFRAMLAAVAFRRRCNSYPWRNPRRAQSSDAAFHVRLGKCRRESVRCVKTPRAFQAADHSLLNTLSGITSASM
jgi:hypothetical protein